MKDPFDFLEVPEEKEAPPPFPFGTVETAATWEFPFGSIGTKEHLAPGPNPIEKKEVPTVSSVVPKPTPPKPPSCGNCQDGVIVNAKPVPGGRAAMNVSYCGCPAGRRAAGNIKEYKE